MSNRGLQRAVVVAPVTVAAVAVLTAAALIRMALVFQSTWWQDDYVHLADMRDHPLSWGLVFRDYADHLEVIPNLFWWLLPRVTQSSWAPAAIVIVVLSVAASATFYLLLRDLLGNRPAILVPLALYCVSPLSLVSATWLASGIEQFAIQTAFFVAALAMHRYLRRRERRWLATSIAAHLIALLFWQKGALCLPVLLGVELLMVQAEVPLRERLRGLARHWRAWLGHVAVLAGFAALYLSIVDGSERHGGESGGQLAAAGRSAMEVLLPGIFGGPWHRTGAANTLYPVPARGLVVMLAVIAVLLIAVTVWRRTAAAWVWVFAAAYVVSDLAMLLWARSGFLDLVARDPRYVFDAVPVVLLCATAAFVGMPGWRRPPRRLVVELGARATRSLGLAAAVAVAGGSLLTSLQLLPVVQHDHARRYIERVMAVAEPDAGESILDTPSPMDVAGEMSHRRLLWALGRDVQFDQPSLRALRFDDNARLVPVTLDDPALSVRGPVSDCGWPVDTESARLTVLPGDDPEVTLVRLGVLTGAAGTLTVTVAGRQQSLDIPVGPSRAWFRLPRAGGVLWASFESPDGAGACVSDVAAGRLP